MITSRHSEYIREVPGSNTVVLFVHGILGTPYHFKGLVEVVPAEWSVYNILLKGHGRTVDDFASSRMRDWKLQVHCLVNKLALEYDHIIIAGGHSMGTLFAIEEGIQNPKVKALFLLNVPLKVYVHPRAMAASIKVAFNKVKPTNKTAVAMQQTYSAESDKRVWKYIKWIPNYAALLSEIRKTRAKIDKLTMPCYIYQSEHDELVRKSAVKCCSNKSNISVHVLPQSGHFYYEKSDMAFLQSSLKELCDWLKTK